MNLEKIKQMCKENPKMAAIAGFVIILFVIAAFQ